MVFCSYRVKLNSSTEEVFNRIKDLLRKNPFSLISVQINDDSEIVGSVTAKHGDQSVEENFCVDIESKSIELRAKTGLYKSLRRLKVVDYYHCEGCYVDISVEFDAKDDQSQFGDDFLQDNLDQLSQLIAC